MMTMTMMTMMTMTKTMVGSVRAMNDAKQRETDDATRQTRAASERHQKTMATAGDGARMLTMPIRMMMMMMMMMTTAMMTQP